MRGAGRRLFECLARFNDERGNVAILFAFAMVLSTVIGAFAVDEGALYLQRRSAQSAVDLAAIAAAEDPANAFSIARDSLQQAGLVNASATDDMLEAGTAGGQLNVTAGGYTTDSTVAVASRFVANASSPNAVRVRYSQPGQLYFAQSWAHQPTVGVEAVASAVPSVTFSVGSTLATLQDGIANAVLNALLGSNVNLSAVSYNGLLNARVNLFGFLDALAQELGITAGTYNDVLAASANQGLIAKALADTLTGANAAAAMTLAQSLGHNGNVKIGQLFDLGDFGALDIGTGQSSGYLATLSALEVLTSSAALSDGTHEVALNLAANVPGLTSLTMAVTVGEPQQFASWFGIDSNGGVVRTAQVRLSFVAKLGGGLALLYKTVTVPLYLQVAYAEAKVQSAACPTGGASTGSAVIATLPGVASMSLGLVADPAFSDFSATPTVNPATLINASPLLKVTSSATAAVGNETPTPLSFSADDITGGVVHTASTSDFTQSLTTSLFSSLSLGVNGLSLSTVSQALGSLLTPLTPVIDTAASTMLNALGIDLGSADVEVYGVHCTRAVLVQ